MFPVQKPKKVRFKWYLHEDSMYEHIDDALGFKVVDTPLYDKIGRPFYEVELECELDTETGEVTLIEARL